MVGEYASLLNEPMGMTMELFNWHIHLRIKIHAVIHELQLYIHNRV